MKIGSYFRRSPRWGEDYFNLGSSVHLQLSSGFALTSLASPIANLLTTSQKHLISESAVPGELSGKEEDVAPDSQPGAGASDLSCEESKATLIYKGKIY